ncbi:cadherin-related family member 2 [Aplochiton taeniatus]
MTLDVLVSDNLYTTTGKITIVLLDANDNKPIFEDSPYNANVLENTSENSVLFKVTATDADDGVAGFVQYSIDEVVPEEGRGRFEIGARSGEVKLVAKLNYTSLSTFYRLKINASDGGGELFGNQVVQSTTAFAFITVIDVPDLDPQFLSLPYTAMVNEHSSVGTSVFTVRAIDQDTGINDKITYSIDSSTAEGLFEINADSGIVAVKSDIDREALLDSATINAVVLLTVKATEADLNVNDLPASTKAELRITIGDINDNKPLFYNCDEEPCVVANSFTGEIFEHTPGAVPLKMLVKDLDQGGQIVLTLEGEDKDAFSVMPGTTISESVLQIQVKDTQAVDYEMKTTMVVQVIAMDPDHGVDCCSTATVTIKIKDVNDNNPAFPKETYLLQVPEHSPSGTTIDTITATDPDTMDVGNLTYSLLPVSSLKFFNVEPKTGTIYVVNSTLIDREVNSLYSLTLQARDTANKVGTTVLEITLTDINDRKPVINRESYLDFVNENGQLSLQIEANDADEPDTVNSQIVYSIMPSPYSENFTINPTTGVLKNNGQLDREAIDPLLKGKIELNVTASDKGDPALSTMVKVIIDVADINDNGPEFKEASYLFYVEEGKKGAFVGSVLAEDLDQTESYNRLSFSIDGGFASFIIRSSAEPGGGYRGNITVDPDTELDYESGRNDFQLTVEAVDLGEWSATVSVKVIVTDVNDERPQFEPAGPLAVKENTTMDTAVGRFKAVDKDGNHSLVYELVSTECRCDGVYGPCKEDWFHLQPSGEITVSEKNVIDYESCDQVRMEAQVVDVYTQKGENNSITPGVMVINIEDINDNAPEFIKSDSVFVVVSESANKGTSIARVTAMDRDSGTNKVIGFTIDKVNFQNTNNQTSTMGALFEIVPTQQDNFYVGIIQSTKELDIELKGKYLVTVTATDSGRLSNTTVLEIFTVDKSFKIELRFFRPVAEVNDNLGAIKMVSESTTMEVYFVYSNGTALTSTMVEAMLSSPENLNTLSQLGLTHIGTGNVDETVQNPIVFALLGLVAGLIIVLAVMTTSLVCTRRSYRTKLKAAKAMKSAAMVTSENQKGGPVVPGTNKYTMEGANPVLNLNIDTTTDLGFDEEGSSADRVSLNSLDYNIDMTMSETDRMPMMMIQEEDEEGGEPEFSEPLGAALAQRGKKKGSESPRLTYNNPVFSTTDL